MPASFDSLPPELQLLVWEYLAWKDPLATSPELGPYACVSRTWQQGIENITFRSISVQSDRLNLLRKYVVGRRFWAVEQLHLRIFLPMYQYTRFTRQSDEKAEQADDEAFTKAVRALFKTLKRMEDHHSNAADHSQSLQKPRIGLYLEPYSRSDPLVQHEWRICNMGLDDDRDLSDLDDDPDYQELVDLEHASEEYFKYINLNMLDSGQDLPSLSRIKELFHDNYPDQRQIHTAAMMTIASKLPNLTRLAASTADYLDRSFKLRRQHRSGVLWIFILNELSKSPTTP